MCATWQFPSLPTLPSLESIRLTHRIDVQPRGALVVALLVACGPLEGHTLAGVLKQS